MAGDKFFQSGGTVTIAMKKIECRVPDSRNYPRGFVRWSSILIRGENNLHTQIVTAYCPSIRKNWEEHTYKN